MLAQEEFRKRLEALMPMMRRWAIRYTREPNDLVQETCLKAWRARTQFVPGTNFEGWVKVILIHAAHEKFSDTHRHRGEKNTSSIDASLERLNSDASATKGDTEIQRRLTSNATQENHMSVLQAIDRVNRLPKQQSAAMLLAMEDMDYSEVSAQLGIPVGTVKSRIHHARDSLNGSKEKH